MRLRLLFAIIDALAAQNMLPIHRVGTTWRLRDMLVHDLPAKDDPESLSASEEWPSGMSSARQPVAFNFLEEDEIAELSSIMANWKIEDNANDLVYVWLGFRHCLFRLLGKQVGIGRHPQFYRPLFDPWQTIYDSYSFRIKSRLEDYRIQVIGEEFYSINHFVPEYIEIESIRLYAAVICNFPEELWRVDRTNPNGEKLIAGSKALIALKVVVNDGEVLLENLSSFYNYFRRKEYFWRWYKFNDVARRQLIDYLYNEEYRKEGHSKLKRICAEAGLISSNSRLTNVGRTLVSASSVEKRRNNHPSTIGG